MLYESVQAGEVDTHSDLIGAFLGGDNYGCAPFCGFSDGCDDPLIL